MWCTRLDRDRIETSKMKKTTNTKTNTTKKTAKAPKATTQSAGCREHPVPYPGCADCEAEATRQEQMKADQT